MRQRDGQLAFLGPELVLPAALGGLVWGWHEDLCGVLPYVVVFLKRSVGWAEWCLSLASVTGSVFP